MRASGANVDNPHGFMPVNALHGRIPVLEFNLDASNTILGVGDLITSASDGYVDRFAATDTHIIGIAAEKKAASAGGTIKLWPAKNVILEAQVDTDDVNAQTDLFLNYDVTVADATNGRSNMEIDGTSGATTATLPIKVIGVYKDPRNALGEFVRVLCMINAHSLSYDKAGT